MEQLSSVIDCPVCLETLVSPIRQCNQGHSVCGECVQKITSCPLCKQPITTARNYQLENVITNLKELNMVADSISCKYAKKGCNIKSNAKDIITEHELECKHRDYTCEGKNFLNWRCNWIGNYTTIFDHFQSDHKKHTFNDLESSIRLKIDLSQDFLELKIIPYDKELFWYKHKIDVEAQTAYWLLQCIGSTFQASKYFYEFTIKHGPVRLIKIREVCDADNKNENEIMDSKKCISIPFGILKKYLSNGEEIVFSFKIGEVDQEHTDIRNGKVFVKRVWNQPPPPPIQSVNPIPGPIQRPMLGPIQGPIQGPRPGPIVRRLGRHLAYYFEPHHVFQMMPNQPR